MYNFTNSPFEKMMKQTPRPRTEPMKQPPENSPCRGCSFWQGMACVGLCYKELTLPRKEVGVTSGHFVPKSL